MVLAALGEKGVSDDLACYEALRWARYSEENILKNFGLARQLARAFLHARKARLDRRERLKRPA